MDRERWHLALARMGKPVEEFRRFNGSAQAEAWDRENLRRQVEYFDPKLEWD